MQEFKFSILAADTVVFSLLKGELFVLVVKAKTGPYKGQLALPGGLVKPSESIEESVGKRLAKYVRPGSFYLEQLYTFGSLNRDPSGRIVSVSYLGLTPYSPLKAPQESLWIPVKRLPILAYDHNQIVKLALQRLKDKLSYTNICFALMPDGFSLGELQENYEIILGKGLDKRNFRKKIFSAKLVKYLGKKEKGEPHRPARLYRFSSRKLENIEVI